MSLGIGVQGSTQERVYWCSLIWMPGNDLKIRNQKSKRNAVRIHGDLPGKNEASKVGSPILFAGRLVVAVAQGCKCKILPGILVGRRSEKR